MASIKQLKEHANADINTDNDDVANLLLDPGTAEAGAVSSSASPLSTVAVGNGDEEAGKMPTDSRAKLNGKQQVGYDMAKRTATRRTTALIAATRWVLGWNLTIIARAMQIK